MSLFIYGEKMLLSEALKKYDRMVVYEVYYNDRENQKALLLNFGDKSSEEILIREKLKHIVVEDLPDLSKKTYMFITNQKREIPRDTIKILRPIYNLVKVRDNVYSEDMPFPIYINYRMEIRDGIKYLYDKDNNVVAIMNTPDPTLAIKTLNL